MSLKDQITEDLKTAMKAGEKSRVSIIRMITAAFKQVEVDERIEIDDARALVILDKMLKQRRESIVQYEKGERQDLADIEKAEIEVIKTWMPEPLSDAEIDAMVEQAVAESGAESIRDMGKVMGLLKPKMQGRADMGAVSGKIKAKLG